jgi:hypothetical protein
MKNLVERLENKEIEIKEVIVADFDGVICKNFHEMTTLSAEILEYHFAKYGICGKVVKDITYNLYYKGYDLYELLQEKNPNIKKTEIDRALVNFYERAKKDVYNKCPISGTMVSIIKKLYVDYRNTIYISSLTSEAIISSFLAKHGVDAHYIKKIYGHESGRKNAHFAEIVKKHPKARISFITDGVHDATQPANIIIGIVEDGDKERVRLFKENAGEKKECYIVSKNFEIKDILQELKILKNCNNEN